MRASVWAVVVTWNRRALLEQCLAHLIAQTRHCDGVVVVDNASDDGTAEMLADAWAGQAMVVRMPVNTGGAGGFNAGIRAAIEAGADEYVMKPFDRETLESKLQIVGMA